MLHVRRRRRAFLRATEVTITDPKVFRKPWKLAYPMARNIEAGFELMEHACREGGKFEADVLSR